jgi:hypothetical protein
MKNIFKANDTKEDTLNKIFSLRDLNTDRRTLMFELSKLSYPELNNAINNINIVYLESKHIKTYMKPLWLSNKCEFFCYGYLFTVLRICVTINKLSIIVDDIDNGENNFTKFFDNKESRDNELNEFKNMFFTNIVLDCKLLREYLNNNKYEKF